MMETKWTPGPWGDGNEALCVKIDRERPWASTVFRKSHDGTEANALIGMTFGASVDEAVANARLIAAACDLYEALDNLVIGVGMGWDLEGMVEVASASLAKARGE